MTKESIKIPDLGGADQVTVIDIWVKEGEDIKKDTPLLTVESEKASMEIPSPVEGKLGTIEVKVGDQVMEGDVIMMVSPSGDSSVIYAETTQDDMNESQKKEEITSGDEKISLHEKHIDSPMDQQIDKLDEYSLTKSKMGIEAKEVLSNTEIKNRVGQSSQGVLARVYASPSVRRMANELGIDLSGIKGSGEKGRIRKEDLLNVVKKAMKGSPLPDIYWDDPKKYGAVKEKPLNKIKKITTERMLSSWLNIPHVTQFDKVDVTELERFRQLCKPFVEKKGSRLTLLSFIIKALEDALKKHPHINSAYDTSTQSLILREYINIGIAVDTPQGLVVPVIKGVDNLSIEKISESLQVLSQKAREGKLLPSEMMGGSMTISSLGGIGGEYFTPIVNPPQVAILGVSKASMQPVWCDGRAEGKLMLPLSLSYDHRVIDGAEAMRFLKDFTAILQVIYERTLIDGLNHE